MKMITGTRDTGKTRKLLEEAQAVNATVVCKRPERMAEKALDYGIYGLQFVSYAEFMAADKTAAVKYVVDDLDEFMAAYAPNVQAFSLTID